MAAEFLMLAHDYNPEKHWIAGWYMSEKLDGMRAFWDGGITRGMNPRFVPFANVAKDDRYINDLVATGLWSRYGKIIHAPDWFLDALPKCPLDGELWMGRGTFQRMRSTVSTLVPGHDWIDVMYKVFDAPPATKVFAKRKINNTNFKKSFNEETLKWVLMKMGEHHIEFRAETEFTTTISAMQRILKDNKVATYHQQLQLPFMESKAKELIEGTLEGISANKGEGLILRAPHSHWKPERTNLLLKVKKLLDAEATVIGYTTGRETDKGSKLLGKLGALITNFNGKRLELSGFTDFERELFGSNGSETAESWAKSNSGMVCPDWIYSQHFPRGSQVTLQYRELSDDGIAKEARYWRKKT